MKEEDEVNGEEDKELGVSLHRRDSGLVIIS